MTDVDTTGPFTEEQVRTGDTQWETALWPKDGRYVVPLKDVVRKAEGLDEGDAVTVSLTAGGSV